MIIATFLSPTRRISAQFIYLILIIAGEACPW